MRNTKKRVMDPAGKQLLEHEDVFADVINGFCGHGKTVVRPEDLESGATESMFVRSGHRIKQIRDVKKYVKDGKLRIALIGIENETGQGDENLPLRIIGYDAADYRDQYRIRKAIIRQNTQRRKNGKEPLKIPPFYPVCTLVLCFHDSKTRIRRNLKECFKVPKELDSFVNDYHVNVFEMSFLTEDQIEQFHSDFRYLADFMVQARKTKEGEKTGYEFPMDKITHVEEFLEMISALTGQDDIRDIIDEYEDYKEDEKMEKTSIFDFLEARGEAKGTLKGRLSILGELVRDGDLPLTLAAEKYGKSPEEFIKDAAKAGILIES